MDTTNNINIFSKEIMDKYQIKNINHIKVNEEQGIIEITLPTNDDIVGDVMEIGKILTINLDDQILIESFTLFNISTNKIDADNKEYILTDLPEKYQFIGDMINKHILVNTNIFSKKKKVKNNNEDVDDYVNISNYKKEHKNEEMNRQKNRKNGLLQKEFLSGTGKFADKPASDEDEY